MSARDLERLAHLKRLEKRTITRLKGGMTRLKKIQRSIRFYEKKISQPKPRSHATADLTEGIRKAIAAMPKE